jgi:hypothetical protein
LPAQPLAPKEVAGGWMASAQREVMVRRAQDDQRVTMQLRQDAQLAAVRLTPAHATTRALAPIPAAVRTNPLAIAAYLANRNLQDTAGEADGMVQADQIDLELHPRDGDRQVVDFDARDDVRVRSSANHDLLASAARARGRFTTERTIRTVAAELDGAPELRVRAEPGRTVQLRPDGARSRMVIEGTTAGSQRRMRVRGVDGVRLFDLRGEKSVAQWRADRATLELKRGDGEPEVTSLLAQGNVRATAFGDGGERAEVALEEVRALRSLGSKGGGRDIWVWRGLKEATAPAAALFDLDPGRNDWSLPGSAGSRWRLRGADGQLERWLKQAGKRWVPVKSVARLQGRSTAALKPATGASAANAFALSARDGVTLTFAHHPDVSGKNGYTELVSAEMANGGSYRSESAQVTADRVALGAENGVRTWVLQGAPAAGRFRAYGELPLTTRRIPGGKKSGDAASWYDARARKVVVVQTFADPLCTTLVKQTVTLSGEPVIGQLPAAAAAEGGWPIPEWEVRSTQPLHLETEGARSILRSEGAIRLTNYDAYGTEQARLRAPSLVVESDASGRSVATFGAPFVAEGVTAAEAFAGLGEAGGGADVKAERVRLISREPVELIREAGSNEVVIRATTLNVLPLDGSGEPVRPVRIPEGVRVIPAQDGSWTFAFLGEEAAAVPLEPSELDELAKLAKGG